MNNSKSNRSRRVTFASVKLTMDFTSMEDAMEYKRANQGKGWLFMEAYPIEESEGYKVTMTVQRPYNGYNTGW